MSGLPTQELSAEPDSNSGLLTIYPERKDVCCLPFSREIPEGFRFPAQVCAVDFKPHGQTTETCGPHDFNPLRTLGQPVRAAMNARFHTVMLDACPVPLLRVQLVPMEESARISANPERDFHVFISWTFLRGNSSSAEWPRTSFSPMQPIHNPVYTIGSLPFNV